MARVLLLTGAIVACARASLSPAFPHLFSHESTDDVPAGVEEAPPAYPLDEAVAPVAPGAPSRHRVLQTSAFSSALDPAWSCGAGEDPSASCCGAVPALFSLLSSPTCSPHVGVVGVALGLGAEGGALPWSSSPPVPLADAATLSAALDAFCPSSCAAALGSWAATFSSRPPAGRLCPLYLDGAWRLSTMCVTDGGIPQSYCLHAYSTLHGAFGGAHTPLSAPGLASLCGGACARALSGAAASTAAVLLRAAPPSATGDDADVARYGAARAAAFPRMLDIVCARDPATAAFCVLESNILARPSVAGAGAGLGLGFAGLGLGGGGGGGGGAWASRVRRAAAGGGGGVTVAGLAPAVRGLAGGGAPDDAPGGGAQHAPRGSLESGDSFETALNPLLRPAFSCSPCGRVLIDGLAYLYDVFGPGGSPTADAALTPGALRDLGALACGVEDTPRESGRTCVNVLADGLAPPGAPGADDAARAALTGLALCGSLAAAFAAGGGGGAAGGPPPAPAAAVCPAGCRFALDALVSTFGCCAPAVMRLAARGSVGGGGGGDGGSAALPALGNATRDGSDTLFALFAEGACGVPGVATRGCRAPLRRFVATRLANLRAAWLSAGGAARGDAVARGWAADLAAATGAPAFAAPDNGFAPFSLAAAPDGSAIVVLSLDAPSDAASVATLAAAVAATSAGAVGLVGTTAALAAAEGYAPAAALLDVTAPLSTSDASPANAPAAVSVYAGPSSGGAGAMQGGGAGAAARAAAGAAALALALAAAART